MPVLVADVQAALSGRCGGLVASAGLDGSAASLAWLEPIAASARELNVTLASPLTVVDADLAAVAANQVSQLLDVAELRALESALGNYARVSQTVGLGSQSLGEVRVGLEAAITRKAQYVARRYGIGRGSLSLGTVNLGFNEPIGPWEFYP
jgi:hypothetical protein